MCNFFLNIKTVSNCINIFQYRFVMVVLRLTTRFLKSWGDIQINKLLQTISLVTSYYDDYLNNRSNNSFSRVWIIYNFIKRYFITVFINNHCDRWKITFFNSQHQQFFIFFVTKRTCPYSLINKLILKYSLPLLLLETVENSTNILSWFLLTCVVISFTYI